jgi:hypothetical protein
MMDRYIIVNKGDNSILCKDKYSSRRYRQAVGNIDKHLVVIRTTKGRAEQERDYLNENYNKGWEIEKVEPIIFKDSAEDIEKRLEEYERLEREQTNKIRKDTAKEIFTEIFESCVFGFKGNEDYKKGFCDALEQYDKQLRDLAKQNGVEVE